MDVAHIFHPYLRRDGECYKKSCSLYKSSLFLAGSKSNNEQELDPRRKEKCKITLGNENTVSGVFLSASLLTLATNLLYFDLTFVLAKHKAGLHL